MQALVPALELHLHLLLGRACCCICSCVRLVRLGFAGREYRFLEGVAGEKAVELPPRELALVQYGFRLPGAGIGINTGGRKDEECGRLRHPEPLQEDPVGLGRVDLPQEQSAPELNRQELGQRHGAGLGREEDGLGQAVPACLGLEALHALLSLDPLDEAVHALVEPLLHVHGLPFELVVRHDLLPLRVALLLLGGVEADGGSSLHLPQQARPAALLLRVPIRDLGRPLDGLCQPLPLRCELLAVASPGPADIDENGVGGVQDLLRPVLVGE